MAMCTSPNTTALHDDKPVNNMMKALGSYASWGYFDPYADGYQTVPVNWGINTERKRQFFAKAKEVTGA
jgi:hypothetical protein